MPFYQTKEPLYTCTCPRFTGEPYPYNSKKPQTTTDVTPNNDNIPRTDICKHIYAVMRLKGDVRYKAPAKMPTIPLNHPQGNIAPHELSTYSEGYAGAVNKDKKNKLWANSMMRKKKKGQKKERGFYMP